MQENLPLVVITGPTATGKSDIGVKAAAIVGGEIISADSMLVYRGMDIGTAKPSAEQMGGITHHLIDIVEPDEEYNVSLFQQQARSIIKDIISRNKIPFMVGGTGLYIRSVIDDYDFSDTGGDESYRKALQNVVVERGPESLYKQLSEIDPLTAKKLHPRDVRRIIRALEVHKHTGRPISSYHTLDRPGQPLYNLLMFGLTMEREALYKRIEQRVDLMLAAGLVEEVARLLRMGFSTELSSMRGLGYKEIAAYLTGAMSLDQAVDVLKRNTRRFAKRQLTWFRRDNRIRWLSVDQPGSQEFIVQEITRTVAGVSKGL
ncbi:MAG: tRNA (adenosine(37)-N6)-dimethylallyltransferase MiaA [Peptococcaceae bacterium]|nr:tRNA (adenosine(37)-N6)-dimethylallyltransferase MiaA [Pelotomaculum propionicicum]NLI13746.1 tRNA (adenosine(37)-N6)-dimethylallyltransferase MiaA [Peptococcaceae bacterium]